MRRYFFGVAASLAALACDQGSPSTEGKWAGAETPSTYDMVLAGMKCQQPEQSQSMNCSYRVGDDLEFDIPGVGDPDAAVTIMRAKFEGDFYVSVGVGGTHHCAIVKPGKRRPAMREGVGWDLAFVSPRNGKVYKTWPECREGR